MNLADADQIFDEILKEERKKQAAYFIERINIDSAKADKLKDGDETQRAPPISPRRSFRKSSSMSVKDRVSFRITHMLRKRRFKRRNSIEVSDQDKTDEVSSFTISDETVPSHLPEKVADSHRAHAMGQYAIPPREKRKSYLNLYQ